MPLRMAVNRNSDFLRPDLIANGEDLLNANHPKPCVFSRFVCLDELLPQQDVGRSSRAVREHDPARATREDGAGAPSRSAYEP